MIGDACPSAIRLSFSRSSSTSCVPLSSRPAIRCSRWPSWPSKWSACCRCCCTSVTSCCCGVTILHVRISVETQPRWQPSGRRWTPIDDGIGWFSRSQPIRHWRPNCRCWPEAAGVSSRQVPGVELRTSCFLDSNKPWTRSSEPTSVVALAKPKTFVSNVIPTLRGASSQRHWRSRRWPGRGRLAPASAVTLPSGRARK